jgi:hypothetical protein
MFAALFGDLALYPQPSDPARQQDAHSLFYTRSAALGLLDSVWGMNEAAAGEAAHPRAAWFQVDVTQPAGLVPVQPFLACIADVMERLGRLDLRAIQVLLPEPGIPVDRKPHTVMAFPLMQTMGWFAGLDPALRAPVRVTLDAGPHEHIRQAASVMQDQMGNQQVFDCHGVSLDDRGHVVLLPIPFEDEAHPNIHNRASFYGTLAKWSFDSLGFLAAYLNDLAARNGVTSPLVFNAAEVKK